MKQATVIALREYERRWLPAEALSAEVGARIHERYGKQIEVEFPSPINGQRWGLRSLGWVGQIPLGDGLVLALEPKVALGRLFEMLALAYDLERLRILPGAVAVESLAGFYDQLAALLAGRVLDRVRQGLYRAYLSAERRSAFVRGRIDLAAALRQPWRAELPCRYELQTADVVENQLLAYTLQLIASSGLLTPATRKLVGRAYRPLAATVSLRPFGPESCTGRRYNRLNDDYALLHALCRFFLERSGPSHRHGDRQMLPFLVEMHALFERFVTRWLQRHLPPSCYLEPHHVVKLSPRTFFDIDILLRDRSTNRCLAILDTKYKLPDSSSTPDIQQMLAYADVLGCPHAFLIYPAPLKFPLAFTSPSGTRIESLCFDLSLPLAIAGDALLGKLHPLIVNPEHR